MDDRFDELSKELARGMSRREAVWRVAGGIAGGLIASFCTGDAWGFKKSPKIDKLCKDFCKDLKQIDEKRYTECLKDCQDCVFDDRFPGTPCSIKPNGTLVCCTQHGTCCGFECCDRETEYCCGEECCLNEETCCPNGCTDLMSDPTNCGECGNVCQTPTFQCIGGKCLGET